MGRRPAGFAPAGRNPIPQSIPRKSAVGGIAATERSTQPVVFRRFTPRGSAAPGGSLFYRCVRLFPRSSVASLRPAHEIVANFVPIARAMSRASDVSDRSNGTSTFFVATANVWDRIAAPLRDRLETIELPGYSEDEKIEIARAHLVGRQLEENGLAAGGSASPTGRCSP